MPLAIRSTRPFDEGGGFDWSKVRLECDVEQAADDYTEIDNVIRPGQVLRSTHFYLVEEFVPSRSITPPKIGR